MNAVLFVCTGNTCRSVMAEYLAKRHFGPSVGFESAGLRLVPSETPQSAVQTLAVNFGIDASSHIPRALESVDLTSFDLFIAIDDRKATRVRNALTKCGVRTEALLHWQIDDPFGDDPSEYDQCALAIKKALLGLQATDACGTGRDVQPPVR